MEGIMKRTHAPTALLAATAAELAALAVPLVQVGRHLIDINREPGQISLATGSVAADIGLLAGEAAMATAFGFAVLAAAGRVGPGGWLGLAFVRGLALLMVLSIGWSEGWAWLVPSRPLAGVGLGLAVVQIIIAGVYARRAPETPSHGPPSEGDAA